jgi:hypothetical protein
MKYAISVTISQAEHDEDRQEMRRQFLAGDRHAIDPDTGDDLAPEAFAALDPGTQDTIAEDELGDSWDSLWLYPDGSEGLDPGPRRLFDTRQEAESAAQTARVAGTSLYEVVEIYEPPTPARLASWDDAMDFATAVVLASGWADEEEEEDVTEGDA